MSLIPWSRHVLEKLTSSQLVLKFPALHGTRRFITTFTARHLSLPWARSTQSMPPSNFLNIHLNIKLPITPRSSKRPLSVTFPHQNTVYTTPLPHTCYMSCSSHSSTFDHPNDIWWVQIINTLNAELNPICHLLALLEAHHILHVSRIRVKQFSPVLCFLVHLNPKYSLQHPTLKHPQPTFLSQCEKPCFTPVQNNR